MAGCLTVALEQRPEQASNLHSAASNRWSEKSRSRSGRTVYCRGSSWLQYYASEAVSASAEMANDGQSDGEKIRSSPGRKRRITSMGKKIGSEEQEEEKKDGDEEHSLLFRRQHDDDELAAKQPADAANDGLRKTSSLAVIVPAGKRFCRNCWPFPLRKRRGNLPTVKTKASSSMPFPSLLSALLVFFATAYVAINAVLVLHLDITSSNGATMKEGRLGEGDGSDKGGGSAESLAHAALATNVTRQQLQEAAGSTIGHRHAIPNILIFTHSVNLLHDSALPERLVGGNDDDDDEKGELRALQANVRGISKLHPDATIRFLSDDDCVASIRNAAQESRRQRRGIDSAISGITTDMEDRLVRAFQNESVGMFKADLCRGAALLETGGLYFDADLGVRMNLWEVLDSTTQFCTVRVHRDSHHRGAFFQAFIGSTRQHPFLLEYLVLFDRYYLGELPSLKGKPLGVVLLKRAYDRVLTEQAKMRNYGNVTTGTDPKQPILVSPPDSAPDAKTTTEIWQEVLYNREMKESLLSSVPYPTWGTRRACKFIVVATANTDERHLTVKWPLRVPFYSRIAGSRMCPVRPNNINNEANSSFAESS